MIAALLRSRFSATYTILRRGETVRPTSNSHASILSSIVLALLSDVRIVWWCLTEPVSLDPKAAHSPLRAPDKMRLDFLVVFFRFENALLRLDLAVICRKLGSLGDIMDIYQGLCPPGVTHYL